MISCGGVTVNAALIMFKTAKNGSDVPDILLSMYRMIIESATLITSDLMAYHFAYNSPAAVIFSTFA
jgi:hypothetical protein